MDQFVNFLNELDIIVKSGNNAKKIIDKINTSKFVDLENDIVIIYNELKKINRDLATKFLSELVNQGKIDLIKSKIKQFKTSDIIRFSLETNNQELIELIGKNFKEIIVDSLKKEYISLEEIKIFILDDRFNSEIKENISTVIKDIWITERSGLIDLVDKSNGKLGKVEDYMSEWIYIPSPASICWVTKILYKLNEIKDLDKIKLLQEINKNFEQFVEIFTSTQTSEFKDFLDIIKDVESGFPENSTEIKYLVENINKIINENFEKILEKYNYNIDLLSTLRKFNIDISKLEKVQDNIINKLDTADLIIYIQSAKGNEGFNKKWDFIELTKQLFKHNNEVLQDETAQYAIAKLLEELCEHENIRIEDLEYGGSGFYNFNIKVGNFILKLGESVYEDDRGEIQHDKRILKPLIRQQYNKENEKGVANIFLEVQNIVDAKWYIGLSEYEIKEELYMIYSELRDRGIRWTDIKPQNVGRLLKQNKENFSVEVLSKDGKMHKEELKSDNYAIGFVGEEPEEVLDAGELVIIDIDYIYDEEDEYKTPITSYYDEFDERYENEKKTRNNMIQGIKEIIKEEDYTREDIGKIEKMIKLMKSFFEERGKGD